MMRWDTLLKTGVAAPSPCRGGSGRGLYGSKLARLSVVLSLAFLITLASPAMADPVAQAIDKLLDHQLLRHGTSGAVVVSLRDGRTIYSRNPDKAFVPASNMKLITTAAILDELGSDYRYSTTVYLTGETVGAAHKGDVYIKGGGDPVLLTEHLDAFARTLKQKGINKVEGGVVGDESRFETATLGFGWAWNDEPWYYSAPFGALNLNRNAVGVIVKPSPKVGQPAVVRLDLPTSYIAVQNKTVTTASGSETDVTVDRQHGRKVITVTGQVGLDYRTKNPVQRVSVPDPALYVAASFTEALSRADISVTVPPRVGVVPSAARKVADHESPPLSHILSLVNKPSDNMIAEILFRTLAVERRKSASEEAAQAAIVNFIRKVAGESDAIIVADGSGLSRRNFISPRNVIAVLRYMWQSPNSRVFTDSLPIGGRDGTLRNRMKGSPAEGSVLAKTGYLSNVSSLSGYVTTRSGEPLAFCILMNNHLCRNADAKDIQDKVCEVLCGLE